MVLKRRLRGASKFEFVVVVALFGILVTFLLNRLSYYEEQAEKTNMEATASTIKSALRVQMSILLMQGRVRDYALLAQQNPLDWLEQNAVRDNDPGRITKPDWMLSDAWSFDPVAHTLIYSVKRGDYFVPDSAGLKRVRWQVKPIVDASNAKGAANSANPVVGVALVLIEPYRWF